MTRGTATVWVIHAGRRGRDAQAFEEAGLVGLSLPPIADLAALPRDRAIASIERELEAESALGLSSGRNRTFAAMLLRFIHDVRVGDHVMTPDPASSQVLAGEITGPYEFVERPPIAGYHHVRPVAWMGRLNRSELSVQARRSIGAPSPLYQPGAQEQLAALSLWRRRSGS
jgi:restriction system protein